MISFGMLTVLVLFVFIFGVSTGVSLMFFVWGHSARRDPLTFLRAIASQSDTVRSAIVVLGHEFLHADIDRKDADT